MCPGVPELVGVDVRHAGLVAATIDHLRDPPVGEPAALALVQPQFGAECLLALAAGAQVPVERQRGLGPERDSAQPTPFAHHPYELLLQIDMRYHLGVIAGDLETSDLRKADASVTEQPDDCLVTEVDEDTWLARGENGQDVLRRHD